MNAWSPMTATSATFSIEKNEQNSEFLDKPSQKLRTVKGKEARNEEMKERKAEEVRDNFKKAVNQMNDRNLTNLAMLKSLKQAKVQVELCDEMNLLKVAKQRCVENYTELKSVDDNDDNERLYGQCPSAHISNTQQ